ncbi:hypothetical protein LOAG_09312 [Loa loa]|uniref:Uncharacterized protein n=1 Tax=Loa loa TaxID=7209 RepID=A0A1S0TRZ5_LOALO|nr:hypothetical protein LOAG_09312 [Loa loa]EFO19183.1 hypothetical protein LOAG_09312 [Loa loa]
MANSEASNHSSSKASSVLKQRSEKKWKTFVSVYASIFPYLLVPARSQLSSFIGSHLDMLRLMEEDLEIGDKEVATYRPSVPLASFTLTLALSISRYDICQWNRGKGQLDHLTAFHPSNLSYTSCVLPKLLQCNKSTAIEAITIKAPA